MQTQIQKLIRSILKFGWKKCLKIAAATLFIWFIWKNRAKKHKTIATRPGFIPITGHLHFMLGFNRLYRKTFTNDDREGFDIFAETVLAEGKSIMYMNSFGTFPRVMLIDPSLVKFVFQTNFEKFKKSKIIQSRMNELLGDGIFSADPPQWKIHRKIGSRMFTMRNLKNCMFNVAKIGDDRFMKKIEELRNINNNIINIYDLFAVYTLDVFVEIAFGESLQIIESIPKPHPFSQAFDRALELIMWRFRIPNTFYNVFKYTQIGYEKEFTQCMKDVNQFYYDLIECMENNKQKVSTLTDINKNDEKVNLLSLFLKHNPNLNKKDLRDIAMNFIIAGRDTTRLLLSWFFYELSLDKNQKIKEKVLKEIDNFYKNCSELTYENIQNHYDNNTLNTKVSYFKYLEACLLETLRLHPAVPFLARFAMEDVLLPGNEGHIIKKGTLVTFNTYIHGRNTNVWGNDAKIFKPERFVEKGLNTFEPHIYPAFNIAPRLCLGRHVALMEAKLVAIRFLRKYQFEPVKDHKVEITLTLVLNMTNGFKIRVTPRK